MGEKLCQKRGGSDGILSVTCPTNIRAEDNQFRLQVQKWGKESQPLTSKNNMSKNRKGTKAAFKHKKRTL